MNMYVYHVYIYIYIYTSIMYHVYVNVYVIEIYDICIIDEISYITGCLKFETQDSRDIKRPTLKA